MSNKDQRHLYHGTSSKYTSRILEKGLSSPSYWGTIEVAQYYAEVVAEEEGGRAVIIAMPLSAFNQKHIEPDGESIAEPLTYTLGQTEGRLFSKWNRALGTWQDCLGIYGSIHYYGDTPLKISAENILTSNLSLDWD
jgi:hypothetical protein